MRTSQEHGILGLSASSPALKLLGVDGAKIGDEKAEHIFRVGDKVLLFVQHTCITASAHPAYFVVDGGDVVREVWVPWKGW